MKVYPTVGYNTEIETFFSEEYRYFSNSFEIQSKVFLLNSYLLIDQWVVTTGASSKSSSRETSGDIAFAQYQ